MMMGSYTLCWLFGAISPFLGKKGFLTLNVFLPKLPRWPRFHRKIWVFLPKTDLNITYSPINESKVGNFDLQVVFNISRFTKFEVILSLKNREIWRFASIFVKIGPKWELATLYVGVKFGQMRQKIEIL